MLDHHQLASETFRWRADIGPLLMVFGFSLPQKKKVISTHGRYIFACWVIFHAFVVEC